MTLDQVKRVYRALQARLGRDRGAVPPDALLEEAFGQEREKPGADSRLRVSVSLLEKCSLLARHPDLGRDMAIEMLVPPSRARTDREADLAARRRHAEARLEEMVRYVEGARCRHVAIARHFGQDLQPCGDACDHCLGTRDTEEEPVRASAPASDQLPDVGRVILRTVLTLPFGCGRTGLVKVLAGAVDSPVKEDRCALVGCLAGFVQTRLGRFVDRLVDDGFLARDPEDEYRRLSVTPAGMSALKDGSAVLPNPNQPRPERGAARERRREYRAITPEADAPLAGDADDRFEVLRAWRRIEAQRASVPPYVVFHDTTLRAIARANPDSLASLKIVPGVGARKLELYGESVLAALAGVEV